MKINELSREQLENELKARCVYCKKDIKLKNNFTALAGEYYHVINGIEEVIIYADNQATAITLDVDDKFVEHFKIGPEI